MSKLEQDVSAIKDQLGEIKVTLAVNTQSLGEHMRRTEALERKVDSFWSKALLAVSLLGGVLTLLKALLT